MEDDMDAVESEGDAPEVAWNGVKTPLVDVTNLAFQKYEVFLPDKEILWTYPKEKDGWMHAHNSIRREITVFKKALNTLGNKSLEEWEKEAITKWWAGHYRHVKCHHRNEDKLFNPALGERIIIPEKLEADHKELMALVQEIDDEMKGLTTTTQLSTLWKEYEEISFGHLYEEEQVGLPLMRAYFKPAEIKILVQAILKTADDIEMGSFFHTLGHKKDVMQFMQQEGIPFFVWHLKFKRQRAFYRKEMESHVLSLIKGEKVVYVHKADLDPAAKNASSSCFAPKAASEAPIKDEEQRAAAPVPIEA